MNEFFTFILNETILKEIIRPGWIKLYDYNYIDKTVIEGLLKIKPKIKDLLDYISSKATNIHLNDNQIKEEEIKIETNYKTLFQGVKKKDEENESQKKKEMQRAQSQKKITIPKPFKLTENKPRKLKEPNEMENHYIMKPLPIGDYKKNSLKQIEENRKSRLENIKKETINKYNICKNA